MPTPVRQQVVGAAGAAAVDEGLCFVGFRAGGAKLWVVVVDAGEWDLASALAASSIDSPNTAPKAARRTRNAGGIMTPTFYQMRGGPERRSARRTLGGTGTLHYDVTGEPVPEWAVGVDPDPGERRPPQDCNVVDPSAPGM